jgi:CCR4-NOT transcription complex subunit 7/8
MNNSDFSTSRIMQTKTPPLKQNELNIQDENSTTNIKIIDVWADNLEDEMEYIRQVVEKYPYIAMDTEFPGVVARPTGSFRTSTEYHYQTLRCNVNLLKIIQLGLTFSDEKGNLPKDGRCTWQFNFKFNLNEDMYAQDSIDLLAQSGIDFKKHDKDGIDVDVFGELLMSSGIVLNDEVRWIAFHSGYDFGYLLKLLTNKPLPNSESDFFDLLHTYFPYIYDIKYLMKSCEKLKGGLNQLAEDLNIKRIGPAHQAGSDSLLTSATFFKMMKLYFENKFDEPKHLGVLYGLGSINTYSSENNTNDGVSFLTNGLS